MQKLEVYQSLWAMDRRIPGEPEAPVEEHFRRISDAGYHGICIDPALNPSSLFGYVARTYFVRPVVRWFSNRRRPRQLAA